jgi:predicted TIM-barrel fold metal-dependent hydrolase
MAGSAVRPVLEAHLAAAPERLRGIRHSAAWDADPAVLGMLQRAPATLLGDALFRAGLAEVAALGLSYDVWLLAPQLPALIALARAMPHLSIVCDPLATPLGIGAHAGKRDAKRHLLASDINTFEAATHARDDFIVDGPSRLG